MPARCSTATIRRSRNSRRCRDKLAELRKGTLDTGPKAEANPTSRACTFAEGKILRPGMKDARVVALRKRLNIAGDKDNPLYDDAVRDAVKTFQTGTRSRGRRQSRPEHDARPQRRAKGSRSARAHDPIDTILVNMERWRWLPRDLGNPHVIVNVPDYTLTLYNDGKVVLAHQDRGRQAEPGDADGQRGDEVHHRQSDLERAAVDHREGISAGAAAGSAGARRASASS